MYTNTPTPKTNNKWENHKNKFSAVSCVLRYYTFSEFYYKINLKGFCFEFDFFFEKNILMGNEKLLWIDLNN